MIRSVDICAYSAVAVASRRGENSHFCETRKRHQRPKGRRKAANTGPSKQWQLPGPMTDCPHMRVTHLQVYQRLRIIFSITYGTAWSAPA